MFWEKVNEKLIFVNADEKTRDEVFDKVGGELVRSGNCKESFVGALKEREKVFPTGILVGETGVAIPHTDPEHIKDSAIAIATLKEPVNFYHMGTNPQEDVKVPVTLVIMLAIAGRSHLDMLQNAIQLIQDQEVVHQLLKAQDAKEIIKIIKNKEEKQ